MKLKDFWNLSACMVILFFSFTLTSCSDDDNDNVKTFTIQAEGIYHSVIEVQWAPVDGAYAYKVFYQRDGATEWEESNFIMPQESDYDEEGVIYELDYNLYPETKYNIYVVVYRDSQNNIIAKSNQVTATTLAVSN